MDLETLDRQLDPLPYQRGVVAYLKQHEPDVWAWASSQKARDEHLAQVRAQLLRGTYRLEVDAHPEVHALLALAMERLGIRAPAMLYQAGGQAMNAVLVHVPGEVHIVLEGPLLERLSEDERLALFGHELAHYLLWSQDQGEFLVADRILQDAVASTSATDSHRETARCYGLHTELFADRGAALAARALAPAVSVLVKVQTGIANPDPAAYLRQALEVEAASDTGSQGSTHPETFIRARALELWWQGAEELEAWTDRRLRGPLSLSTLDLPRQAQLQAMTRGFLTWFLAGQRWDSAPMCNQVRQLFADWAEGEVATPPESFTVLHVADDVRAYLNALMLDLALVDPEVRDVALERALVAARVLGSEEALLVQLKRDAGMGKREIDRLRKRVKTELPA